MRDLKQTMAQFLAGPPRRIEGAEIDGWCGLEGDGYITDLSDHESIVIDVTPAQVGIEYHDHDTNEIQMWILTATKVDMS